MARIPTVAAPGQAVGTVKTGFTPQPYQRLDAPIEAFGGGDANTFATLKKSLSSLGADLDEMNKADDKIASLKMQAEIEARTAEYEEKISSVVGQERLNMLAGTHHTQMEGAYPRPSLSLEQQYKQDLALIRSKYQFATAAGGEVADIAVETSTTNFGKTSFAKGLEARKLVMEQTVATTVGNATVSAVQGVTDDGWDEGVLEKALGKVATAVTDVEVGMAKLKGIDDPKYIELLVKEQKALVISKVFDELVSRNNLSAASDLIDEYTTGKGILAGTPVAATMQSKILPYKEEIRGRKEFSTLITSLGPEGSNPLKVLEAIDAVSAKDPVKYERLTKQYTSFSKILSAKRTEAMNGEISGAFAKLAKGEQVKYLDIPTLAQTDPRAAAMFVLGKGGIEERTQANERQETHKADGGGSYNVNMDSYMNRLSKVNPQGYLDIVKSEALKGMVSADQLEGYRDKATDVQKKIDDSTQGAYNIVGQLKTRFRFNNTKAGNLASQKYPQITQVINDTRREIFERTGKKATTSEIDRAVATMLIEFETGRMWGTGWLSDLPIVDRTDLGANFSTQLAIDADDVPSDSVRLRKSEDNMYVIAAALGVGYDQVKGAMDDEGMSLKELAQKLDVQTPQSLEETQEKREEWQTLSYENGIAFSFMEDAFRDSDTAWNTQHVKTFLRNAKTAQGQAIYNKWLETR